MDEKGQKQVTRLKISRKDFESLQFAVTVLHSLAKATTDQAKANAIKMHIGNLRKFKTVVFNAYSQSQMSFEQAIHTGITETSPLAKGLSAIENGGENHEK
ncbi:MAG: hypothetical protein WC372_10830 [Candidatus Neomarinimicrobiota bacterium]|jgi:purine-nucleoside phosphorylase